MHYLESVHAQPDNLARSHTTVAAALRNRTLPGAASGPGTRPVLTGMGASLFAARPAVEALRRSGRAAYGVMASDLLGTEPGVLGDLLVAVSQSGRSAETATAVRRADGLATVAVCNEADSPVAEAADVHIPLGSAADPPVSTLTYTASLQALGLLAERLGAPAGTGWAQLPRLAQALLETSSAAVRAAAERWTGVGAVDVVGRGEALSSAGAAALLIREAVRIPATATDTYQYLHGPIEAVEPGAGCLVFGAGREVELARSLRNYGAEVLLVTTAPVEPGDNLAVVQIPRVAPLARPVLEILPVQLLVWHLAQARGLDVSGFRHHQYDTKLAAG